MWISPLLTKMCKVLVLALVAVVPLVSMAEELSFEKLEKMEDTWTIWKKQHSKAYSPREETYRRMVFFKSLLSIEEHNSKYPVEVSYTKGLNQFSDMTLEEYRDYNKLNDMAGEVSDRGGRFLPPLNYDLPTSVDWRNKGCVTPIKDQGQCGASYAFTTTGVLEGQHARKTGALLSLSEQQLIDCAYPGFPTGCISGTVLHSYLYIIKQSNGLETEGNYTYQGQVGSCVSEPKAEQAPIHGWVNVPSGDEKALQYAVASVGPIAVNVDSSHDSFQSYNGGLYYEPKCSSTKVNLPALIVGYGIYEGLDYWLVKCSWGKSWGDKGYIMMSRNRGNNCGIATMASYPTV